MKAHITNLGLANFRVFKDKTHFEFAPITILTGMNSSGKSSLINSILVLKDSLKQSGISNQLNYRNFSTLKISPNSIGEKFGDFKNLLSWGTDSNMISYDFEFIINDKCLPINVWFFFKTDPLTNSGYGIPVTVLGLIDEGKTEIFNISFLDYATIIENLQKWETIGQETHLHFDLTNIVKFIKNGLDEKNDFHFYLRNSGMIFNIGVNHELLNVDELIKKSNEYLLGNSLEEVNFKFGSKYINDEFLFFLSALRNSNSYLLSTPTTHHEYLEERNDLIGLINLEDTFDNAFEELSKLNGDEKIERKIIELIKERIEEITSEINSYDINLVSEIIYVLIREKISKVGDGNSLLSTKMNWGFELFLKLLLERSLEPIKYISETSFFNSKEAPVRRAYSLYEQNLITTQLERILSLRSGNQQEVLSFIRKWLINFGIAEDIIIQKDSETAICRLALKLKSGKEIILADFGHGIFKLIPLILSLSTGRVDDNLMDKVPLWESIYIEGLFDKIPDRVFCIEEPESNLHPALQSKIADMFIDAARTFNTQFIIETHSEYLIRKLQYLTAKGEIKPEDTAIYYFYPPDDVPLGQDQVKRINIQDDGSLSDDFGTGFFDEADKIAMSIWNMNKSQKN